ncbi:MAG TPA: sigma-70 family RNA polymerase sigma factor [Pyrinomonadaceae bacterium]|nr:sigma-70 family RNA polymerase sigma factor [Pyrinomonadaceae bacterium]
MSNENVTQLLKASNEGNREALDQLLPIVYDELRRLARHQLSKERSNHTLQATALVNEAYLKLIGQHSVDWNNRAHFFSIAAETMRRILVNHAVERNAQKRGGGATVVSLDDEIDFIHQRDLDVLALDDSLKKLEEFDKTQAKIIELKFFGGMTNEEIAEVLGVSDSTVKREWRMAKAWLQSRMK